MPMHCDILHGDTEPAAWLVDNIDLLLPGRVLDVAMGNGRNSVYLAKLGFQVEGIDIDGEAVASALRLAGEAGVNLATRIGDLESDSIIATDIYDAVICFYYLHRPLIKEMKRGLKTGGVIVYETYLTDQSRWGKPQNPDHLLRWNELLELFREFRVLRYREGIIQPRKAIASLVAQKL